MKEHPILFSGPMVRAILDGSKTQTRRICDAQAMGSLLGVDARDPRAWGYVGPDGSHHPMPMKYGVPGDRLWVRETWGLALEEHLRGRNERQLIDEARRQCPWVFVDFRATPTHAHLVEKWRPSIHMPRWASRITLEATEVRVERLQEITREDAIAEGISARVETEHGENPRDNFRDLWNMINGERAPWASNPWVWVIGFKRVMP